MAEQNSFEVEGPGGVKAKGKGPFAIGAIFLIALFLFLGWYVRKDVMAMSKEHKALAESVDKMGKAQQQMVEAQAQMVEILSRQTELFKLSLELQAKPVEKRKEFLQIYKTSPTWKGNPERR